MDNYPSKEVVEFGERVAFAIDDASISRTMNRFGGCEEVNLNDYPEDLHQYITAYLTTDANIHAITYAAMRTKELEGNHV